MILTRILIIIIMLMIMMILMMILMILTIVLLMPDGAISEAEKKRIEGASPPGRGRPRLQIIYYNVICYDIC